MRILSKAARARARNNEPGATTTGEREDFRRVHARTFAISLEDPPVRENLEGAATPRDVPVTYS